MQKVAKRIPKDNRTEIQENLKYWLSCTPDERVKAVELLREQVCGRTQRLQRVARLIKRSQG